MLPGGSTFLSGIGFWASGLSPVELLSWSKLAIGLPSSVWTLTSDASPVAKKPVFASAPPNVVESVTTDELLASDEMSVSGASSVTYGLSVTVLEPARTVEVSAASELVIGQASIVVEMVSVQVAPTAQVHASCLLLSLRVLVIEPYRLTAQE